MNNTTTIITNPSNAGLLAGLCGGLIIPFLLAAYFGFVLLRKSRFSLCWNGCNWSTGILRLWEHSLNCVVCFPKAKPDASSSCCCCKDPKDFDKRHLCQRVWLFLLTLIGLVLPFLLLVICGLLVVFFITPVQIGFGVLFLSLAIFLLSYAAASYSWNGWYLTTFATFCIVTASLLLCAYAFVSALLIEPLTFTGVSAVAMAFQMLLTVPAMYIFADGRGISVSFQEWSDAVKSFVETKETNLIKKIQEESKKEKR